MTPLFLSSWHFRSIHCFISTAAAMTGSVFRNGYVDAVEEGTVDGYANSSER